MGEKNIKNNQAIEPIFDRLFRTNSYVKLYYPDLYSFLQSLVANYSDLNDIDPPSVKIDKGKINTVFDEFIGKISFIQNSLVAVVPNQPQYIINDDSNCEKLSKLSKLSKPLSENDINHAPSSLWPSRTISDLDQIQNDYFFTTFREKLSQITTLSTDPTTHARPYDLSTLPLLFTGKRYDATSHLYSLCSGLSTHSTTSNLTPGAQNTKIAPQYSIGVVLESGRFIFGTDGGTQGRNGQSCQNMNKNGKKNHLFLNIIIFLHWLLQHSIPVKSLQQLIDLSLGVAMIGADNGLGDAMSVEELICVKMLVINLLGLYTHCGIFLPR